MEIKINYGNGIVALPSKINKIDFEDVTKEQLAVLICISVDNSISLEDLSKKVAAPLSDISAALSYWQNLGLITYDFNQKEIKKLAGAKVAIKPASKPKSKTLHSADELPVYTLEQQGEFLEAHKEIPELIDTCSAILGKILTTGEINTIIGMTDYLGLTSDYIVLLFSACVADGKKSVRYIEQTAINLFDSGITDYSQLETYLEKKSHADDMTKKIRSLLGLGDRALTKKEKDTFFRWSCEWNMSFDLISLAYEKMVDTKNIVSVKYMDTILESYHVNGIHTVEEANNADSEFRKNKDSKTQSGTFDTDEFFTAALKRSYGEDNK